MTGNGEPHRTGRYWRDARDVRDAAYADPRTPCWRCGRRLDQHPRHKNGRMPFWTAGHVRDGEQSGQLLPEVSVCNFAAGARLRNELENRRRAAMGLPPRVPTRRTNKSTPARPRDALGRPAVKSSRQW
jgi:hypothetical protein